MGSVLSGRRNGKPLVENCLTLDLAWLMRLGPIRDGQAGGGEIQWSVDGELISAARFRLDLRDTAAAELTLMHNLDPASDRTIPERQIIALTITRQPLGGHRWWMRCPMTGNRVRTLHRLPDRDIFASRQALRLAYSVERLNHFDRPFERLMRAQRKLGCPQGLGSGLQRPKGMWRRTYARHLEHVARLDAACAGEIVRLIKKE